MAGPIRSSLRPPSSAAAGFSTARRRGARRRAVADSTVSCVEGSDTEGGRVVGAGTATDRVVAPRGGTFLTAALAYEGCAVAGRGAGCVSVTRAARSAG